jgi:hypothetical protein
MVRRPMRHLPLKLVVELDGERNQNLGEQRRQRKPGSHGADARAVFGFSWRSHPGSPIRKSRRRGKSTTMEAFVDGRIAREAVVRECHVRRVKITSIPAWQELDRIEAACVNEGHTTIPSGILARPARAVAGHAVRVGGDMSVACGCGAEGPGVGGVTFLRGRYDIVKSLYSSLPGLVQPQRLARVSRACTRSHRLRVVCRSAPRQTPRLEDAERFQWVGSSGSDPGFSRRHVSCGIHRAVRGGGVRRDVELTRQRLREAERITKERER